MPYGPLAAQVLGFVPSAGTAIDISAVIPMIMVMMMMGMMTKTLGS